jgi:hypothetical protein
MSRRRPASHAAWNRGAARCSIATSVQIVDKHYFADGCFSEMPRCVPKYRSPFTHAFAIAS